MRKRLPLIVANLVQESMGQDAARLTLIDDHGSRVLPEAGKSELAQLLLQHIAGMLQKS